MQVTIIKEKKVNNYMEYYDDYIEYIKTEIYPLLCELRDAFITCNKRDQNNFSKLLKLIKKIEYEEYDDILNKDKVLNYLNELNYER